MRQYIAPFGFDTRRVTRPVIGEGIDSGDQIVLLQPASNFDAENNDYGTEKARTETENLVEFFGQVDDRIRITSAPVVCNPFEVAVREISALLTDPKRATRVGIAQNDGEESAPPLGSKRVETIVCFGAGPRELLFAAHTASAAHASHVQKTILHGDLSEKPAEVSHPRVNPHISQRVEPTFQAFVEETPPLAQARITDMESAIDTELSVTDISERTDKSKSTVGRHLDELESEGLIETRRGGKERFGRLTLSAELYLRDVQTYDIP
jgi:CRISPR-associated protein Csa3